jgi:hypothetical protein
MKPPESPKAAPFSQGTVDSPDHGDASRAWEVTRGASWESTATDSDRVAPPEEIAREDREHFRFSGGGSLDDSMLEPEREESPTPRETSEETLPLTGHDASALEAQAGSAGSGASPWGADQTGLDRPAPELEDEPLEEDPGLPRDIAPDRIEPEPSATEEE